MKVISKLQEVRVKQFPAMKLTSKQSHYKKLMETTDCQSNFLHLLDEKLQSSEVMKIICQ